MIVPTGRGKRLCFLALPLVFDCLRRGIRQATHHSILIVISPLTALMKDQVSKYGSSVQCTFIAEDCDCEGIIQGNYQVVYASPETMLGVPQWREMLRSTVYQNNVIGIVVDEAHCMHLHMVGE